MDNMPSHGPTPAEVGTLAASLLAQVEASPLYDRLRTSSERYSDCWLTTAGFALVRDWNERNDSGPLFGEAMRAMALKAAVWQLTHSEELAELLLPPPVDEMTHAIIAQPNVWTQISAETGFRFVHMTDLEQAGYKPGGYTYRCYLAAWGEEPPARFWLDETTVQDRRAQLEPVFSSVGLNEFGRSTAFTFVDTAA